MSQEVSLVLKLQSIDQRIAELQKEIADLPKHIAQIERTLEQHIRRLEADRSALAANTRDRKKLESDVKVQEEKKSKLRDQMSSAKTNEQYRAFQNEINYCDDQIRKFEDRILDLMGSSEPLERNVAEAEQRLTAEKVQVEGEKKRAQERTAADQTALAAAEAERKEVVAALSKPTFAAYERIRRKWRGAAVAEATAGRCSGCQMMLRPQFFQELRMSEGVMFCESCGRILYYNAPVVVDEQAGPQPAAVTQD